MSGDPILRDSDGSTGLYRLSNLQLADGPLDMTSLSIAVATTGQPGNLATVGESCCTLQIHLDSFWEVLDCK